MKGDVGKLTELLARVEGASGPDREIDADICVALQYPPLVDADPGAAVIENDDGALVWRYTPSGKRAAKREPIPLTSSIDASVALIDIAFTSDEKRVSIIAHGTRQWAASGPETPAKEQLPRFLLAALLKALIAKQAKDQGHG